MHGCYVLLTASLMMTWLLLLHSHAMLVTSPILVVERRLLIVLGLLMVPWLHLGVMLGILTRAIIIRAKAIPIILAFESGGVRVVTATSRTLL